MNKISIIVESILAACVVALFIIFFTVTPGSKKAEVDEVQAYLRWLNPSFLYRGYMYLLNGYILLH